jgi:hypothetical protein
VKALIYKSNKEGARKVDGDLIDGLCTTLQSYASKLIMKVSIFVLIKKR